MATIYPNPERRKTDSIGGDDPLSSIPQPRMRRAETKDEDDAKSSNEMFLGRAEPDEPPEIDNPQAIAMEAVADIIKKVQRLGTILPGVVTPEVLAVVQFLKAAVPQMLQDMAIQQRGGGTGMQSPALTQMMNTGSPMAGGQPGAGGLQALLGEIAMMLGGGGGAVPAEGGGPPMAGAPPMM